MVGDGGNSTSRRCLVRLRSTAVSEISDVVPEDKDWTWVLDARCDDCGFDAPNLDVSTVTDRLKGNADQWVDILRRSDVRDRPTAGVWSPLEYACHVRDVFRLYDYRLQLMLTQDDPHYPNWDQDETAVTERYREQDPAVVSEELVAAQRRLSTSFAGVQGTQWRRTGNRSDHKCFTVESFARYMLHDPIHHVWDVTRVVVT
jgi:hypothetical protein